MRVLKFGGAALRDGPAVRHALGIVREFGGESPLVVVSAHAGVTRLLEEAFRAALAGDLLWDPLRIRHRTLLRQLELPDGLLDRELRELRGALASMRAGRAGIGGGGARGDGSATAARQDERRLLDLVLSFGERLSARVFAAALRAGGAEATPLDAHDLGLLFGREGLGPPEVARHRLLSLLEHVPGIPVVTGFFALDGQGHLATLGRNGSDLTASWLGAAVGADEVQLWKRVPGIQSADPTLVPEARTLERLGWEQAEALARHGSGVLHPETVAPVREAQVMLRVRDLDRPGAPGTLIEGAGSHCVALAHRTGLALLRLRLEEDRSRRLSRLFAAFAEAGVEPYLACVRTTQTEVLAMDSEALERIARDLGGEVETRRGLATVALIGPDSAGVEERRRRTVELALGNGGREFWSDGGMDGVSALHRVLVFPGEDLPELAPRLHDSFVGPAL